LARFLALDWDQNQLHVVSANVRGSSVQVQRAAVWTENRVPNPAEAEELGQTLRERLKEAGIAPAPVLACVGRDRVIVKEVRFPNVPDAEEPALVRFQAVKELTDNAEDVVIDYAVSGTGSNGEKKAAALVVRREVLATYQKICQAAGLKLAALTPRLVGISECIRQVMGKTALTPPPEPADGVFAVVVIGEKTAELCVMRDQTFLLTRSLTAGANLTGEVRRNLAMHNNQMPQATIKAVYVAGKGAGELRELLGSALAETAVHVFDPFAGSEAKQLPTGNRGTFAGAVGLLHAKAAGQMPINFVSPREPKPPKNPHVRLYRVAAVAFVAVVVTLIGLGQLMAAMKNAEAETLEGSKEKTKTDYTRKAAEAKQLKALDDWDAPVWGDELYELTARINDVNQLRATSIQLETIPRTANSKFAGRLTIRGKLLNKTNPRGPLDDLIRAFRREGYYSPQAPKIEADVFTLVVNLERRPPGEYQARLEGEKDVKEKAKTPEKDKKADKDKKAK
jgi:hypothetical protein